MLLYMHEQIWEFHIFRSCTGEDEKMGKGGRGSMERTNMKVRPFSKDLHFRSNANRISSWDQQKHNLSTYTQILLRLEPIKPSSRGEIDAVIVTCTWTRTVDSGGGRCRRIHGAEMPTSEPWDAEVRCRGEGGCCPASEAEDSLPGRLSAETLPSLTLQHQFLTSALPCQLHTKEKKSTLLW